MKAMPKSLWAATAIDPPELSTLEGERRADLCVVGGGFTGMSAALHAAEAGADVSLVEAAEPGWGASGRNGGMVLPGLKYDPDEVSRRYPGAQGERLIEFAGAVTDTVFELIDRHGIDCGAERSGWIVACHGKAALSALESRVRQWQDRGVSVELLDADRMSSTVGTRTYVAGMSDPRGGKVQPLSYARGLAAAAVKAGANVYRATPARRIESVDGKWRIRTPQGSVSSDQVLLCTNGYTDALWPGLEQSVIPAFSYQVATTALSDNLRRSILPGGHVVSDTKRLLRYFSLDRHGRLLMGGRGKSVDSSDPALYRSVIGALHEIFPQVSDVPLEYFWGGRIALTRDHLPHVHGLAPGVHAALGYNGRGVAMATCVGKMLADRVAGTPLDELPFPATALRTIAWHAIARPVISLVGLVKRAEDAFESR